MGVQPSWGTQVSNVRLLFGGESEMGWKRKRRSSAPMIQAPSVVVPHHTDVTPSHPTSLSFYSGGRPTSGPSRTTLSSATSFPSTLLLFSTSSFPPSLLALRPLLPVRSPRDLSGSFGVAKLG